MRKIIILGSTGSIGRQALDVVANSDELEVVGLTALSDWEMLRDQATEFNVEKVALVGRESAVKLTESLPQGEVLTGTEGLTELIIGSDAELVLNSIVGAAGLMPTVVTLTEGKDLALANKESLVIGGELVTQLAEARNAKIVPVDSEHSAIFQLVNGERACGGPGTIERLVLTASGGPFRGFSTQELNAVLPSQALKHPTWEMGGKVTVDSATLMNKGLEIIEAHHLFAVPCEQIDVVVHPQSIVHGMANLIDGSTIAHLGTPDMRVPISYALHYPERSGLVVETVDLSEIGELTFEKPDQVNFGCLRLARRAAGDGGTMPCTMNAANEIAVGLFLEGNLPFLGIERLVKETMDSCQARPLDSFDSIFKADSEAREVASSIAAGRLLNRNGAMN